MVRFSAAASALLLSSSLARDAVVVVEGRRFPSSSPQQQSSADGAASASRSLLPSQAAAEVKRARATKALQRALGGSGSADVACASLATSSAPGPGRTYFCYGTPVVNGIPVVGEHAGTVHAKLLQKFRNNPGEGSTGRRLGGGEEAEEDEVISVKDGRLLHNGNLQSCIAPSSSGPVGTSHRDAVRTAAAFLRPDDAGGFELVVKTSADPADPRGRAAYHPLPGVSAMDIVVESVYYAVAPCDIRLAYQFFLHPDDTADVTFFVEATGGGGGGGGRVLHHYSNGAGGSPTAYSVVPDYYPDPVYGEYYQGEIYDFWANGMVGVLSTVTVDDSSTSTDPRIANSSPKGWRTVGTTNYLETRGNNVVVIYHSDGQTTPLKGDGTGFDYSDLDLYSKAYPFGYEWRHAAAVNLFYWANVIHDVLALYGFDEGSGNLQEENYVEGTGGDKVVVRFAHSSYYDTGYSVTRPEGTPCDIYLGLARKGPSYSSSQSDPGGFDRAYLKIGDVPYTSYVPKMYGPSGLVELTNRDVVHATGNDNMCLPPQSPSSTFAGKVVLLDRVSLSATPNCYNPGGYGSVEYSNRIYNAQQAGAVGVIIRNMDGLGTMYVDTSQGYNSDKVTVPAVLVTSVEDGADVLAGVTGGGRADLIVDRSAPYRDAGFALDLLGHEYFHLVGNRLVQGASTTCLIGGSSTWESEGMGEGYSDFFALWISSTGNDYAFDATRGLFAYVAATKDGGGRWRDKRYSPDMNVNDYTYGDIVGINYQRYHQIGQMWATCLWDLYWALVQTYGYTSDKHDANGGHGNTVALKLVVESLKELTACFPTMAQGRDALLAADAGLYPDSPDISIHRCLIWAVFARRGLGTNVSGNYASGSIAESYDRPPGCPPLDPVFWPETLESWAPTVTPGPTASPTSAPTPAPTTSPTPTPTRAPVPSATPTVSPTAAPTVSPTPKPSCVGQNGACNNNPALCCSGVCAKKGQAYKCTKP